MLRTSCKFHKWEPFAQDDTPARSEIQQHLGASLAQIFFDYNHREITKLLGSLPSTKLQQSYRTTQNDQLKTNAIRRWSQEQEILKSRIHCNILALGETILKKFQMEIEAMTRNVLMNEFAEKCRTLEAENRLAIRRNAEEIHARYEEYFEFTQRELEEKLQVEWIDANAKHNKELQKAVVKTRIDTTHHVLKRMRPEISHAIMSLYIDLEQSYRAQRETMIADFNEIMRKEHVKLDARIKEAERKKMEELHIQRHELEIQNATDIMFILCIERLRNNMQIHAVHKQFEEKIKFLHDLIVKQDETMNIMKEKITEYRSKNMILGKKITAITAAFQQFINLAFDAMPEHADFLLSLDLSLVNDTCKKDGGQEKNDQSN